MTPKQIKNLRESLKESREQFGARFHRSWRTIESWEQGLREPDPLALDVLAELAKKKTQK